MKDRFEENYATRKEKARQTVERVSAVTNPDGLLLGQAV
jgi:hypothetical protein